MRVRFVGGPRHNRICEVGDLKPIYHVAVKPEGYVLQEATNWLRQSYYLHRFRTAHRTKYVQYIHESLIGKDGRPDPCTCKERFKKWELGMKT